MTGAGAGAGACAVRVVVAPDKFKGTLTGPQAARAMAAGVRTVLPDAVVRIYPLADGGEGTVEAVLASGATRLTCTVPGPLWVPVEAHIALLGDTAVIEAAQACGLQLVAPSPQSALRASSAGVGTLVEHAWAAGARRLVVGLGGVATTDAGVGLASALGVRFLDADGAAVLPGELERLAAVRLDGLDARVHDTAFVAATDVSNPLLGPTGAAAVYGPQKGAGPREVRLLEAGLRTVADVVEAQAGAARDVPGAGAAGGLGWALMTLLGASVRPGADLVMDLVGLAAALDHADLVVTGEGRLDAQSRYGKGPVALAARASSRGLPTLAVAGAVEDAGPQEAGFAAVWSLTDQVGADAAWHQAAASLTEVTARAVRHWVGRAGPGRHTRTP